MTNTIEGNVIDYLKNNAPLNLAKFATKFLNIRYQETDLQEGVSGFLRQTEENSSVYEIVVNRNDGPKRKRFTIAHELGHFFMHKHLISRSLQPAYRAEIGTMKKNDLIKDFHEIEANRFAASILLPEQIVRQKYAEGMRVNEIADYFEVSYMAAGFRLDNLGLNRN
jgi:Zn-dependent peptidase ImmA (M78 family)